MASALHRARKMEHAGGTHEKNATAAHRRADDQNRHFCNADCDYLFFFRPFGLFCLHWCSCRDGEPHPRRDAVRGLYHEYSKIVPQWLYLSLGLLLLMYICQLTRAYGGLQPGAVVFFVVIYTVSDPAHFAYVFARILDTGIGVVFSLLLSWLFPSPQDTRDRQLRALEDNGKRLLMLEKDLDAMKDYQSHLRSELNKIEPLIADLEKELAAPIGAPTEE